MDKLFDADLRDPARQFVTIEEAEAEAEYDAWRSEIAAARAEL